ncbi:MAG: hypothetical protein KKG84_03030 [Candidatus Omnitrophica bacterium]|nr:hypothetical protein [Candidatus Omnitrophota bacterium]
MKKVCILAVSLAVTALMISGCGGGASETKPIATVKQEAQTMNTSQLKSMVAKYQQAIEAKKPAIQKLQAKLKAIPVAQMMGEDAAAIKKEIGNVTASIKALSDRMRAYLAELNKKGGSI